MIFTMKMLYYGIKFDLLRLLGYRILPGAMDLRFAIGYMRSVLRGALWRLCHFVLAIVWPNMEPDKYPRDDVK